MIQRREQLLQAYQYVCRPYDQDRSKVVYLLMMAAPGSGKTRMINAIPQSMHVIQEEIERILNETQNLQEELDEANASPKRNLKSVGLISNKILSNKCRIDQLRDIKAYVETNVVFLPITFNSENPFRESETNSSWMIASRMLFKYYAINIGFAKFCKIIKESLGEIFPKQALEAIRHDQMFGGDDDESKRKSDQCRVFLMVDEMGLIHVPDLQDRVFQVLRGSFIGEITLFFHLFLFLSFSLASLSWISFSFSFFFCV